MGKKQHVRLLISIEEFNFVQQTLVNAVHLLLVVHPCSIDQWRSYIMDSMVSALQTNIKQSNCSYYCLYKISKT